ERLRTWARALGIETFVGSSGRVFPRDLKAAPLLRAWLHRLRAQGVRFHMRHRWTGWGAGDRSLRFDTPAGVVEAGAESVVLALGGASWPRLGSDGAWVALLRERGIDVQPLQPSNCGFDAATPWSELFRGRFAGQPLKNVALEVDVPGGPPFRQPGEFVVTAAGRRGDQQRGRRAVRCARGRPDAARHARRALRRRDARLGGADGRLPAHRVLRERPCRRPGGVRATRLNGGISPPSLWHTARL